jgi:hypothetical protein
LTESERKENGSRKDVGKPGKEREYFEESTMEENGQKERH